MIDESGAGEPGETRILLQRDDGAGQSGEDSRLVSGSGADDESGVGAPDRGGLQQSGGHHRLHQIAAAAKRQIIVDIGDRPQMLGHEQLAPGLGHGGEDPFVGHLVGSDLALDHVRASRVEYRHPATGGQWAAGL